MGGVFLCRVRFWSNLRFLVTLGPPSKIGQFQLYWYTFCISAVLSSLYCLCRTILPSCLAVRSPLSRENGLSLDSNLSQDLKHEMLTPMLLWSLLSAAGWVKKVKTPEELELERLLKEVRDVKVAKPAGGPSASPAKTSTFKPTGGAVKASSTSYSSGSMAPPPPGAKKTYGSAKSTTATAPPVDDELEALLKKLDDDEKAAKVSTAAEEDMDPELTALLKQLDEGAVPSKGGAPPPSGPSKFTAKPSSYTPTQAKPAAKKTALNFSSSDIIKTANDRFLKETFDRFIKMSFLKNYKEGDNWTNFLVVEWETIFSDPGFSARFPDPATTFGYIKETRTTQGFMTSMKCWQSTMTECCHSLDTIDRNLLSSVKKFVITYDSSLPDYIEPVFKWDKNSHTLTTVHNSLSIIDGVQSAQYYFGSEAHNGWSSNWFLPMIYVMNDQLVPYHKKQLQGIPPKLKESTLVRTSGFNARDHPDLYGRSDDDYSSSSSSFSSSKSSGGGGRKEGKCSSCSGTGNWGKAHNFKTCIKCKGSGISKF